MNTSLLEVNWHAGKLTPTIGSNRCSPGLQISPELTFASAQGIQRRRLTIQDPLPTPKIQTAVIQIICLDASKFKLRRPARLYRAASG